MFVPLIKFNVSMAEMGCESALKPDLNNNIELPLDGRRRRISLPEDWNGTIGRNELRRFNFSVSAPKSSSHLFQLVLELADGSQVTSPTVDLSYFEPRLTGLEERRRLEEERQQRESEQREQEQQQQDPPK
jgi:hypothetical protein